MYEIQYLLEAPAVARKANATHCIPVIGLKTKRRQNNNSKHVRFKCTLIEVYSQNRKEPIKVPKEIRIILKKSSIDFGQNKAERNLLLNY